MAKVDLKLLGDLAFLLGSAFSTYYLWNLLSASASPETGASEEQKRKMVSTAKRLDREVVEGMGEHEFKMLANVVHPEDINQGFADIGGLDDIVDDLRETVIFPLTHAAQLGDAPLLQAPKGVLLYGPPGCGKTMLAKALAKESGANFINVPLSSLMDKWYGESNKIVAGLFTLAYKLAPCIIFIDEIDSFMRTRQSSDHEASAAMKAEFMTWWDGLTTSAGGGVLILGATNRMFDIDDAILRRMPKRFAVQKPGPAERLKIMQILLQDTPVSSDLDWKALIYDTDGKSGSDLKEYCRAAAMNAMKELYRIHYKGKSMADGPKPKLRPLRTEDFVESYRLD